MISNDISTSRGIDEDPEPGITSVLQQREAELIALSLPGDLSVMMRSAKEYKTTLSATNPSKSVQMKLNLDPHVVPQDGQRNHCSPLRGGACLTIPSGGHKTVRGRMPSLPVRINCGTKLARWCDRISPGEDGLSGYVRLLEMDTRSDIWSYVPSSYRGT